MYGSKQGTPSHVSRKPKGLRHPHQLRSEKGLASLERASRDMMGVVTLLSFLLSSHERGVTVISGNLGQSRVISGSLT